MAVGVEANRMRIESTMDVHRKTDAVERVDAFSIIGFAPWLDVTRLDKLRQTDPRDGASIAPIRFDWLNKPPNILPNPDDPLTFCIYVEPLDTRFSERRRRMV